MTQIVAQMIRKLMGWCPQISGLAEAGREKQLWDDTFHKKISQTTKVITTEDNLVIDYQDFNVVSIAIILAIILFSIVIAVFVLMISTFFVPIIRNFAFLILSAGFLIVIVFLMYVKRVNAEITVDSIIVNRPVKKPIIIPKNSILKTDVVKNFYHSASRILTLPLIIWLAISLNTIADVLSHYFAGNYSLLDVIPIILVNISLFSAFISIYFIGKKKSTYPSALKITAKLKNEVYLYVYVDDPQKLKKILDVIR